MPTGTHSLPDDSRDERVGKVLNDYLDRRARGEPVSDAELLAQHPDLADELRAHLGLVRELRPPGAQIGDLLAQGVLAPASDPRYAAELGAYQIVSYIGRGGMGIVLKAYEESLNRTVALKLLRPELADDQAALLRFEREAKAAAALHHPNIVTVYAVGHTRGVHFIAMEYVEGTNLAEVLRRHGPLPPELVRRIFRELLAGLAAAHAILLIHRDIKTSNILLALPATDGAARLDPALAQSPLPLAKIADFGLARMHTSQTRLTTASSVVGTPEYMSPEQARGETTIDQRADLYSAGVVLYEMLTGRTPFHADSPTATIHRILYEEPTVARRLRPDVDPALSDLALRLMAKQPADRFATANEVLTALDANTRVRSLERQRRLRRRCVVAAVAAVLLVAGAWWSRETLRALERRPPAYPRTAAPTAVWIDERDPTLILARYGATAPPEAFYDFPAPTRYLGDVSLLDRDGAGDLIVIASVSDSTAPDTVFAFDRAGRVLWSLDLSANMQWPDCGPPTRWRGGDLLALDVDAVPGDELLIIATDANEYPARVTLIDPRTQDLRATYWHWGGIGPLVPLPDFFGPGHPAVMIPGLNNKLDGFFTPEPGDDEPCTYFDLVSVVMILDPGDMDGLAPPRTGRLPGLTPARPYAYAFLDAPYSPAATHQATEDRNRVSPRLSEIVSVAGVQPGSSPPDDDTGPWFAVALERPGERPGPGTIIMDRHLTPRHFIVSSGETINPAPAHWFSRWHPIFQERQPIPCTDWEPHSPPAALTAVERAPDRANVVRALRGENTEWADFFEFPAGASLSAVTLADLDGAGLQAVVVGLARPIDGANVVAFNVNGRQLWASYLRAEHQWPDCAPSAQWTCHILKAANLDGVPGDELIVVASDAMEYPTRVSLLNALTGEVRTTFWNQGDLDEVYVEPRFFDDTRPALVVAGLNNKLDGFDEPRPDDPAPRAHFDITAVMMVLDPANMDGVGPPHTARIPDLPPAQPYAYVCLDLAPGPTVHTRPAAGAERRLVLPAECGTLRNIAPAPYDARDIQSRPQWIVDVLGPNGMDGRTIVTLDRDLNLLWILPKPNEVAGRELEYWRARWLPIFRRSAPVHAAQP